MNSHRILLLLGGIFLRCNGWLRAWFFLLMLVYVSCTFPRQLGCKSVLVFVSRTSPWSFIHVRVHVVPVQLKSRKKDERGGSCRRMNKSERSSLSM